jgi:cytochrome b involved in lipid metabolism
MSRTFTRTEVASHNRATDLWIIIDTEVFDVTEFQRKHPGGDKSVFILILIPIVTILCTHDIYNFHHI